MKEPPYDDSLLPALILLGIALLFTAMLLGFMWGFREDVRYEPPSSTLPALIQK